MELVREWLDCCTSYSNAIVRSTILSRNLALRHKHRAAASQGSGLVQWRVLSSEGDESWLRL